MPLIISNASPLIGLAGIDRLYVLKLLWKEISIPNAVYEEVVEKGAGKTGADIIEEACGKWIKVAQVSNKLEVEVLRAILDKGEAEVIALGQELKADLLLLDNREPRLFARTAGIDIIGTIGIIKLAWKKGIIKDPLAEINKLKLRGFWIGEKLITGLKKEIDE